LAKAECVSLGVTNVRILSSEFPVIFGCSELPVLKQKCDEAGLKINNKIIDPLQSVIDMVVDKYNQTDKRGF
jgi:hypothetical protein